MNKINIKAEQYWKYKIIEYEYKSIHYEDGDLKVEICKALHKTNCYLFYILIILSFRVQGIKYEVVKEKNKEKI